MAPVKFKCPHRPLAHEPAPKYLRLELRNELLDVPEGTAWERVTASDPATGEPVFQHFRAEIVCPRCGDTIVVTTSQKVG